MTDSIKIHCKYDELLQPGDLKPHPKNRNKHPKDQIKTLARIIDYQGWRYPVKVSKASGYVTSGHGRIEAAKILECPIPVNYQEYVSEEQEYADVQSDNAIAAWSELDLSGINSDIGDLGPDFDVDLLGIKDFVIEPADKYGGKDEDDVPEEPEEPKTKLGDLYRLGEHRLLCGDATKSEDVDRLLDGATIDMVYTDPPYGIGANKQTLGSGKKEFYRGSDWDNNKPDLTPFLKLSDHYLFWGGNYFTEILPSNNHWFCWHKKNDNRSFSEFELAASNSGKNCRHISHHWGGEQKQHPTQKPVNVIQWSLKYFDSKALFDPFGGSGSTLIACEKTNRKCFMMELEPKYCDVIVKRWEEYTGEKAELLNG